VPHVLVGTERISTEIAAGSCAYDVVGDKARQVVVARVNDEIVDLSHPLSEGDVVEPILIGDPEGLSVLRHSVAHIVAQATQAVFDDVKLGIGPPIKDG
jgi:threonyl-tRNA synthetase